MTEAAALPTRVLIVDDDAEMCRLVDDVLRRRGYSTASYERAEDALGALDAEDFDVVVTDVRMPGIDGVELCQRIVGNHPDIPVVVLTAYGLVENAVGAMRAGACEFLRKPLKPDALATAVQRAAERRGEGRSVKRISEPAPPREVPADQLLGSSPAMTEVIEQVRRAAASDQNVLLTGESGTGKELVARLVHAGSARAEQPFVAVSCAAIPENLIESELFGHEAGAYTGADESRLGFFVRASGGTVLLDEIGEMPLHIQPKLLRVLQDRRVRPVGSNREREFDTRLVAATNRDLHALAERDEFRSDLLYRLDVLHVHLPPLRERGEDVLDLADHFLCELAGSGRSKRELSPEAREALLEYPWPGNVRELRNCLERAHTLSRGDTLTPSDLPPAIRGGGKDATEGDPRALGTLESVERRHIQRVLEAVQGNKVEAARLLGVSRATLYRKLERLSITSS